VKVIRNRLCGHTGSKNGLKGAETGSWGGRESMGVGLAIYKSGSVDCLAKIFGDDPWLLRIKVDWLVQSGS
jgi:hypothetical protein